MEAGTTSTTLTARLPILNPGEYDLWLMRIEQYFLMTDYSLWEVILNGNKVLKRTVGETEQEYEPTTAEEKQDRRNEMKARGTLLMALPNKDQLNQPNGSQLVHKDLKQFHEDDLEEMDLKWQLALLSMRTRRFFQKTSRNITINGSDTAVYEKSKVECFNYHKMGHFARECRGPRNQDNRNMNQDSSKRTVNVEETSSKAMVAIDEAGFD
ncbi:ribonuclease H-like domain-containing protein [Tanacetum coccineum]